MKVLHVTNLYPYKEAPTYGIFVKEQVNSLRTANLQNVFFINARLNSSKEYLKSIKKLKNIAKDYDIIHCHHQFSSISVFLANRKSKIITSILGDIKKRSFVNKLAFLFSKIISKKVIFKNEIPHANTKFILLPNGVNLNIFKEKEKNLCKQELGLDKSKIHVLFVSNGLLNNPIKRHDKFLEIIQGLNNKISTKSKYVPLYLNNVPREKVSTYFNAADLMILTSDHEGSPNAVKEAMACNLPIVSTSVGDVPVLLGNVKNSFVSKSGTVEELVDLAFKIDLNIRSNGREKLIELKLDSESVAEKLINIYSELHNE